MVDRPQKTPTVTDVAQVAGVSATTVSYVLNGRAGGDSRISEATKQRVLDAVDKLGYVQNNTARHLRRRTTERVCLALPGLGRPYHDILARQLYEAAEAQGFSVCISVGGGTAGDLQIIKDVRSGMADGLLIDYSDSYDPEVALALEELAQSNFAVVVMGNEMCGRGFDIINTTEEEASYRAVRYLLDRGHKRVTFMAHSIDQPISSVRYRSYIRALEEAAIDIDESLVIEGAASREAAYRNTQSLLSGDAAPTAVFSASDIGALSAMAAAQGLGLHVPDDFAIIGCGNSFESRISTPRLTTAGPTELDFSTPIHFLFERLQNGNPIEQRRHTQHWELLIRDSS
jgi:DNA-binding LacI/PurR family transcriptional regulator